MSTDQGEVRRKKGESSVVDSNNGLLDTLTPEQDERLHFQRSVSITNAPSKQKIRQKPLIRTKLQKSEFEDDKPENVVKVTMPRQVNGNTSNINIVNDVPDDKTKENPVSNVTNSHSNDKKNKSGTGLNLFNKKHVMSKHINGSISSKNTLNHPTCERSKSKEKPVLTSTDNHSSEKKGKAGKGPHDKSRMSRRVNDNISNNNVINDPLEKSKDNPLLTVTATDSHSNEKNDTSGKGSSEKPKYYKSKFWEYIDPKRKSESRQGRVEREKVHDYDPREIKSFMEKQREVRQIKEKRENEEKQKALEKKRKQLEELNDKCRKIVASTKSHLPHSIQKSPSETGALGVDIRKQANSSRSGSRIRKSEGSLPTSSNNQATKHKIETDVRTSILLQEFENIVQKECMSILRSHRVSKSAEEATPSKVDVAVETTLSLCDNNIPEKSDKMRSSESPVGKRDFQQEFDTLVKRNKAAARIQAAYRGYKVRKILKEARLTTGKSHRPSGSRRRWSFYKAPGGQERSVRKLSVDRSSIQWDMMFIPPPDSLASTSFLAESPRPKSLATKPSSSESLLSRFEEPFPKDALRRLSASNSPRPKTSFERRHSDSARLSLTAYRRSKNDIDVTDSPRVLAGTDNFESLVPAFSTVLREKVRLLEEKNADVKRKQENKFNLANLKRLSADSYLDNEYDSDSTEHASVTLEPERSFSNPITEEYIGPDDKKLKEAYDLRKGRRTLDPSLLKRSIKNLHRQRLSLSFTHHSRSGSTTTVETDSDLQSDDDNHSRLAAERETQSHLKSESSFGIENYTLPAMKLRYEAEKERLSFLDQAFKVALALGCEKDSDECKAIPTKESLSAACEPEPEQEISKDYFTESPTKQSSVQEVSHGEEQLCHVSEDNFTEDPESPSKRPQTDSKSTAADASFVEEVSLSNVIEEQFHHVSEDHFEEEPEPSKPPESLVQHAQSTVVEEEFCHVTIHHFTEEPESPLKHPLPYSLPTQGDTSLVREVPTRVREEQPYQVSEEEPESPSKSPTQGDTSLVQEVPTKVFEEQPYQVSEEEPESPSKSPPPYSSPTQGDTSLVQEVPTKVFEEQPYQVSEEEPESPSKSPPPYSSPAQGDTSLLQEVPLSTVSEDQLCHAIEKHIEYIWDSWVTSNSLPSDYESYCFAFSNEGDGDFDVSKEEQKDVFEEMISNAICESMQEILKVPISSRMEKPFLDKIRPGPLALRAQQLRIPRTKERLFRLLYDEVIGNLPPSILIWSKEENRKLVKRCTKWTSRIRDLADDNLAQEMIKEDREWTDCWPEEVLVTNRLSENIMKRLVSDVICNFQAALS